MKAVIPTYKLKYTKLYHAIRNTDDSESKYLNFIVSLENENDKNIRLQSRFISNSVSMEGTLTLKKSLSHPFLKKTFFLKFAFSLISKMIRMD